MWDLETLRYMNQQAELAHYKKVERANEAAREIDQPAPAPSMPVYPLAILSRLLLGGPPSIGYILQLFDDSELISVFMDLVEEYLPNYAAEIRAADVDERLRLFSMYFERHYFPLGYELFDDYADLEGFLSQIPVDLRGFSSDDYHSFVDFRTGYIMLLALTESPFYDEDGHGGRVAILAHISDLFGQDVAELVPVDGFEPAFLHKRTDGTRFDGVGVFADWINSQTNCWVLDANYEDYGGEPWREDTIHALAEQWPRVVELEAKMHKVVEFIEVNPKKRFLEMLNLLLDINMSEHVIPDEQLPLPLFDNA